VKLTSHLSSPIPCRSTAIAIHPAAVLCSITDEPSLAILRPTQTLHQVRLDSLKFPGPLALTVGDPPRRNPASQLFPPLTPAKGLFAMVQIFPGTFLQKKQVSFLFF